MTDTPPTNPATAEPHHKRPMPTTIVRASWAGTAAFAVTAIAAVAVTEARIPAVATAATLFTAGIGIFFWAYAIAVARSRTDSIGIGGLFFLAGKDTPPPGGTAHKRQLLASLATQTATALATAGARPFTTLAFGVLVPLYGLALTGLYGARHGRFGPRPTRK